MAYGQDNIIVPSPINPVRNPAWLYVPLARIVVPVEAAISNYYLQEDGIGRFLSEDNRNLFIQE